jgi:acetolactate synthase regulatory subunit
VSVELALVLRRAERAFERVVGLAGRRGYEIVGVSTAKNDDGRTLSVRLTLEPRDEGRSPETLVRQLAKLVEVESVRIDT